MVDVLKDQWGEFQQPAWCSDGGSSGRAGRLVAKPGLDGHDRGGKARRPHPARRRLRGDLHRHPPAPESIASVAVQEDVQIVGLSILSGATSRSPRRRRARCAAGADDVVLVVGGTIPSGAHIALTRKTTDALRAAGADDVLLVVGGTIPQQDVKAPRSRRRRRGSLCTAMTRQQPLETPAVVDAMLGAQTVAARRPASASCRGRPSPPAPWRSRRGGSRGIGSAAIFTPPRSPCPASPAPAGTPRRPCLNSGVARDVEPSTRYRRHQERAVLDHQLDRLVARQRSVLDAVDAARMQARIPASP